MEEHEREDDEGDNDSDGFTQYNKNLDIEIASRIRRAERKERENMISEERLAMARGDDV